MRYVWDILGTVWINIPYMGWLVMPCDYMPIGTLKSISQQKSVNVEVGDLYCMKISLECEARQVSSGYLNQSLFNYVIYRKHSLWIS